MADSSWNHTLRLKKFPQGASCSGPNCPNRPEYHASFETEKGPRNLAYCREHAGQFAWNFRIHLPRTDAPDPERLGLRGYTVEGLRRLAERIAEEISRRETAPAEFTFNFDGLGTDDFKPYVARMYWKDGRVQRYFYDIPMDCSPSGKVTRTGTYSARGGSVVERRSIVDGVKLTEVYLVMKDGRDLRLIGKNPLDGDRELVRRYLTGDMSYEDILAQFL